VVRNFNHPLYFPFPSSLLSRDRNVVHGRLCCYATPHHGYLGPLEVGPDAALRGRFDARLFRQIRLTQLSSWTTSTRRWPRAGRAVVLDDRDRAEHHGCESDAAVPGAHIPFRGDDRSASRAAGATRGGAMLGLTLAGLVALGLIGIGVGALVAPRASSRQYGVVPDDPRALALFRAMGVRDLVIGVLVLLLLAAARRDLLALGIAASSAIALLDFAVVSRDAPQASTARLLHGGGALGLLSAALVIALGW
jgi:hypothetical protein